MNINSIKAKKQKAKATKAEKDFKPCWKYFKDKGKKAIKTHSIKNCYILKNKAKAKEAPAYKQILVGDKVKIWSQNVATTKK